MFFTQHIDSILQIAFGACFTWLAFRRPSRSNKFSPRTVKIFKICGPALIVIGTLLMLKPTAAASWQRHFTLDKRATAEFPGTVTAKESTDTMGTASVKRTTITHDVSGKDIALFLSYSALPNEARGLTDAQRIESTLAYFVSQGSKVIQNEKTAGSPTIYRLTLRQDSNRATMQMALAYVDNEVYRVVASWTDGQEDRPLTDRFVNSFRVTPAASQ